MGSMLFRGPACVAVLLLTAACSTTDRPARIASDAAVASTAPATVVYRSTFDGYRPDKETEVGNWKQANDTVRTIGGWRSYAREGAPAPTEAPR